MRTPCCSREADSLINRPVTFRTIPRFWHPRTGITAFLLLLSTTTELVVLNLIPQHDPQSDSQLASDGHTRLPQAFLYQFAAVKTLQLRILACGMRPRFTPEKPQQRVALFTQPPEPLSPSTRIFTWNHSHITSQGLAVCESGGIAQKHLGRQRGDRPHSGMAHQQPRSGTFAGLLLDSLVQFRDLRFELLVHRLQLTPPIGGMRHQRQRCDPALCVLAPQGCASS